MRAHLKANRYSQYEAGARPLTIDAGLSEVPMDTVATACCTADR
jgi:hypothetical protein